MDREANIQKFAYYAFYPVILAFLFYVGFGYYIMISREWPEWTSTAVVALCLLILSGIYFLVRHTGFAIYNTSFTSQKGWRRLAFVGFFLGLFAFSGYGFLTSSMLLIEGPDIARSAILDLSSYTGKLDAAAEELTNNPEYNAFAAGVKYNKQALMEEINNKEKGYCGIGEAGSEIIRKIQAIGGDKLSFTMPSDAPPKAIPCNDKATIRRYMDRYGKIIDSMLISGEQKFGMTEKSKTRAEIQNLLQADRAELDNEIKELSLVNYFVGLAPFDETLKVVDEVSNHYRQNAGKLRSYVSAGGKSIAADAYSDAIGDLHQLGSPWYLLTVILHRITRNPTIPLCLAALICDFLAAWLVALVLQRQRRLASEQKMAADAARAGGKDVTYLWQPGPPAQPATGGMRS